MRLDIYYTKEQQKTPFFSTETILDLWLLSGVFFLLGMWAIVSEPGFQILHMRIIHFAQFSLWIVLCYVHVSLMMELLTLNSVNVEGDPIFFSFIIIF